MYLTEKNVVMPNRASNSKKGDNGTVLVVGGSENYVGACALAGISAFRGGADLVIVSAPEKVAWAVNCLYPDLITVKLPGKVLDVGHRDMIMKYVDKADCIVLGNGAGLESGTQELFRALCSEIAKPKVIDADAIKAVSLKDVKNGLFTPHKAEFEILLSNSCLSEEDFQPALGDNVVLLKGAEDEIYTMESIFLNKTGNAGMTKGGTGDVLAGLCGGFMAQRLSLVQSAKNAAYIAGLCGDRLLKDKKWYSYIASDVVKEIGRIRQKIEDKIIKY